ncbi:MAG: protein kinase, partial [bacterium]|nr:protein kinase [bacterium]
MARMTVDPDHWQRVEPILDEVLELAPENRPAFLDQACAGDPELRTELEALLAADEQTGGPLEAPIGNLVARLLRGGRSEADSSTSSLRREIPPQPADGAGDRFLPGTMLAGRYRIVSVLGRGGMGEVFRADDLKLEVPVALKFLPAELATDQERLSLLLNEVRVARQISHSHVCRVFDVGEARGLHFISMEYIDGEDLATLLRRIGRLPSEKAVEIARGICDGLEAVHDQGILHRDLKPANLMIDDRGRVRITDFGVAAVAESVRGAAVRPGTPAYMAPEVHAGREASVQSDLYALGLVLYELFTGRRAFVADSREELLRLHREAPPRPPSHLVDGLDPGIGQVILRCLEKEPHARPASAQAVAAALPGRSALAAGTVLRTLLASALVGSTRLVERLGDSAAAELFADHDRLARDLLAEHGGRELEKTGAGFLLLFARPIHAVFYAQAYHEAVRELAPTAGSELTARVGIHLGELVLRRSPSEDAGAGASPLVAEGLARTTVTRLMSLAGGRQTLLTRTAFDVARRSAVGAIAGAGQLRWLAHGKYLIRELDEPVEVFEVGAEGLATLEPPASTEEATRVPGEDVVLGWRPAPGLTLPGRAHWTVERKLGAGGFGEVWLAVHRKTGERRVFKFCYEASRMRALRREITLFRLLREELGERDDIARILDWNFEEAPFFIESEYTAGGNLEEWAEEQGGLESVPPAVRLELVAQVAEALAAAHSVGVLHKDVKPSNVLIYRDLEGRPRARLTDFGVGVVTEHGRLAAAGFTIMGFTERTETTPSSLSGTRLYMAPEVLEGKTATLQADVYALGVVLYQVAAGDLTRALAPGWARDVDDELLREDVAAAVDGVPERRLANAQELAARLRSLDERRAQRETERRAGAALERARRRRRTMAAAIAVLALFAGAMGLLALRIQREAERAEREAARAKNFARVAVAESWITKDPTRAALVLLEVEKPDEITMAVPAIRKVLQHRLATLELSGHQRGV